jgi:hypothetical protein
MKRKQQSKPETDLVIEHAEYTTQNDTGNQRKIGRRTTCIHKRKGDYRSNFWNKTVD